MLREYQCFGIEYYASTWGGGEIKYWYAPLKFLDLNSFLVWLSVKSIFKLNTKHLEYLHKKYDL